MPDDLDLRHDGGTPLPDDPQPLDPLLVESQIDPNAAFLLARVCPSGEHVGSVYAHISGGRIVLDDPPIFRCGCVRCA